MSRTTPSKYWEDNERSLVRLFLFFTLMGEGCGWFINILLGFDSLGSFSHTSVSHPPRWLVIALGASGYGRAGGVCHCCKKGNRLCEEEKLMVA